jgi:hypothetical protein
MVSAATADVRSVGKPAFARSEHTTSGASSASARPLRPAKPKMVGQAVPAANSAGCCVPAVTQPKPDAGVSGAKRETAREVGGGRHADQTKGCERARVSEKGIRWGGRQFALVA